MNDGENIMVQFQEHYGSSCIFNMVTSVCLSNTPVFCKKKNGNYRPVLAKYINIWTEIPNPKITMSHRVFSERKWWLVSGRNFWNIYKWLTCQQIYNLTFLKNENKWVIKIAQIFQTHSLKNILNDSQTTYYLNNYFMQT